MFAKCSSLIKIPDISIWNVSNVNKMNKIFDGCENLIYFPDISKWKLINMDMDFKYEAHFSKMVHSFKSSYLSFSSNYSKLKSINDLSAINSSFNNQNQNIKKNQKNIYSTEYFELNKLNEEFYENFYD